MKKLGIGLIVTGVVWLFPVAWYVFGSGWPQAPTLAWWINGAAAVSVLYAVVAILVGVGLIVNARDLKG